MSEREETDGLKNRIGQVVALLAEERKYTSIEIAETLWLALQIEPAAKVELSQKPEKTPTATAIASKLEVNTSNINTPLIEPSRSGPQAKLTAQAPAGVLPRDVLPVWLPDPTMLKDPLAIVGALKPLLRKVRAGDGKRLDERATVNRIARTRLWLPVLQAEQEPWFDIVLVVDRGSSMHPWQRLVDDLVGIFRRYGAFRDLQVFDLEVHDPTEEPEDRVLLRTHANHPGHRPSELIDKRGRRIAIVLSDCAGKYWWDGTLLPMLQAWAKIMPTVVWQMLPEWMWERTALGRGVEVTLRNDRPGAANQQLIQQLLEQMSEEPSDIDRRVSVPVVTSELRDLENWSAMLAGDSREATPGFLLPQQQGQLVPRSRTIEQLARERVDRNFEGDGAVERARAIELEVEAIARTRVQRFRKLASPQARRLVMLLAAAPVITLPVMRLIRDSMLHDTRSPLPVAEVFLSGLLQRLEGQEGVKRREQVQYDFVKMVREVLLGVLPEADTIEVINSVSAEVERNWSKTSKQDFRAFLTDPNSDTPEGMEGVRSFASVTATILEQLGGEYKEFAQELRYGSGEGPRPPKRSEKEPDFTLHDVEYKVAKLIVDFPPLQECKFESVTIAAVQDRFDFETATLTRKSKDLGPDRGWRRENRRGVAWGYSEILNDDPDNPIVLDTIAIPGGSFQMGAPKDELECRDEERPQHAVTLQPFHIGRYPVTQAQWRVVASYDSVDKDLKLDPSEFTGGNRPVESVTWEDAQEFCKRLSAKTGKDYRLPSEAEWEYACRAGTTTPFHFGETITTDLANYCGTDDKKFGWSGSYGDGPKGEYREQTTEVGIFPANGWGLHDMHGNVWEWCEDDWHDSYKEAPDDGSAWVETSREGSDRLLRGGSWVNDPWYCRSASRIVDSRGVINGLVGFRVCCVPPRAPS
ncbi:MAG: SAV_2336 N-terminal domain-related protein [Synechococcus sp.]